MEMAEHAKFYSKIRFKISMKSMKSHVLWIICSFQPDLIAKKLIKFFPDSYPDRIIKKKINIFNFVSFIRNVYLIFYFIIFSKLCRVFYKYLRHKILFKFQEKFNIPTTYAVSHIYRSSSELYRQQWEYTYRWQMEML